MTPDITKLICDAHISFKRGQTVICQMYGDIVNTWPASQRDLKQEMMLQLQKMVNEGKIDEATKRYSQLRKDLDCEKRKKKLKKSPHRKHRQAKGSKTGGGNKSNTKKRSTK